MLRKLVTIVILLSLSRAGISAEILSPDIQTAIDQSLALQKQIELEEEEFQRNLIEATKISMEEMENSEAEDYSPDLAEDEIRSGNFSIIFGERHHEYRYGKRYDSKMILSYSDPYDTVEYLVDYHRQLQGLDWNNDSSYGGKMVGFDLCFPKSIVVTLNGIEILPDTYNWNWSAKYQVLSLNKRVKKITDLLIDQKILPDFEMPLLDQDFNDDMISLQNKLNYINNKWQMRSKKRLDMKINNLTKEQRFSSMCQDQYIKDSVYFNSSKPLSDKIKITFYPQVHNSISKNENSHKQEIIFSQTKIFYTLLNQIKKAEKQGRTVAVFSEGFFTNYSLYGSSLEFSSGDLPEVGKEARNEIRELFSKDLQLIRDNKINQSQIVFDTKQKQNMLYKYHAVGVLNALGLVFDIVPTEIRGGKYSEYRDAHHRHEFFSNKYKHSWSDIYADKYLENVFYGREMSVLNRIYDYRNKIFNIDKEIVLIYGSAHDYTTYNSEFNVFDIEVANNMAVSQEKSGGIGPDKDSGRYRVGYETWIKNVKSKHINSNWISFEQKNVSGYEACSENVKVFNKLKSLKIAEK